ncbi:MAG: Mth938-like domain-containing protein [Steroidobacteraceae bacterium]
MQDLAGPVVINAYEDGVIVVDSERYRLPCAIDATRGVQPLPLDRFADLDGEWLCGWLPRSPSILLLGCGARQQFAPRALRESMQARGTATEAMPSAAACRTFNVLAAESRDVVALLFTE